MRGTCEMRDVLYSRLCLIFLFLHRAIIAIDSQKGVLFTVETKKNREEEVNDSFFIAIAKIGHVFSNFYKTVYDI